MADQRCSLCNNTLTASHDYTYCGHCDTRHDSFAINCDHCRTAKHLRDSKPTP